MRTEQDLREAFQDLARRADAHPAPVFDELTVRGSARRRVVPVLVAAVAVAAAIAIPTVIVSSPSSHHPAPHLALPTAPAFDLRERVISVAPTDGFTDLGIESRPVQQSVELISDAGTQVSVGATAAGSWTPPRPPGARTVTVHGRPGFWGRLPQQGPGGDQVGLAWEYSPGAWAFVRKSSGLVTNSAPALRFADALALADHARIGDQGELSFPVRIDRLPAGLHYAALGIGRAYHRGALDIPGGASLEFTGSTESLAMEISVGPATPDATASGQRLTVDGHPAYLFAGGSMINVVGGSWLANVSGGPGDAARYSGRTLVAFAQGLHFASNPLEPATWFGAGAALPR